MEVGKILPAAEASNICSAAWKKQREEEIGLLFTKYQHFSACLFIKIRERAEIAKHSCFLSTFHSVIPVKDLAEMMSSVGYIVEYGKKSQNYERDDFFKECVQQPHPEERKQDEYWVVIKW
jgi:hypothetical protein